MEIKNVWCMRICTTVFWQHEKVYLKAIEMVPWFSVFRHNIICIELILSGEICC